MGIKRKVKKIIKNIIFKTMKILNKFIYKIIPTDEKTVMFTAFHGKGYLCNPKAIHQYMINSDEFKDYKYVWAVKRKKEEIPNCKKVRYNGIRYFYYLARSKYWIFNCKMPKYVLKKDNQVYLQTWHGTPLKRLGHDIETGENATFYRSGMSREDMVKTYDEDVKKYNYFISPNSFSTEKFKSSFRVSEDKIIETGYPRNDFLTNITANKIEQLKEEYNIPKDKKVILYAPTWRDNSFTDKGYTFELKVDFNKWKELLGEEYIVIFKPHYLISNKFDTEGLEGFLYSIKESSDINELYVISDVLITDYSSVFFDYAILNRPVIFYMYDLEEYRDELRGFYLDINKDLPGDILEREIELLNYINNIEEKESELKKKISNFNKIFNNLQDGKCSKKVLDIIIE